MSVSRFSLCLSMSLSRLSSLSSLSFLSLSLSLSHPSNHPPALAHPLTGTLPTNGSVTVFSAQCLAALSDSFDDDLHSYLPDIVKSLVRAMAAGADEDGCR
jgi:hypothetical protein